MQSKATTVEHYLAELLEDKRKIMQRLRETIQTNISKDTEETMQYGMITYVIPYSVYPPGYHCAPKQPLPFISLAAQKNFFAFYHMGMYAKPELLNWYTEAYEGIMKRKPDVGKSCIRFKKAEHISFELLTELVKRMTASEWIELYEKNFKRG
ncbi:MAG: DUF1801 domain-containing protein [Cryomorphaceae bacterium]|jgi:uncharacterized protein YdhG (YjbR/CyaY superfamily)|nr:DUF1801 domain-containing protein [Cryomorphaceae bacterium]